jgi:hypothetical protein
LRKSTPNARTELCVMRVFGIRMSMAIFAPAMHPGTMFSQWSNISVSTFGTSIERTREDLPIYIM